MPQEKDWLWRAYPSGYDYAGWTDLETADPTLLMHLERKKGSTYEDAEYRYKVIRKPHFDTSVQRKPKRKAAHAIQRHIQLVNSQGEFDVEDDVWYIDQQERQQELQEQQQQRLQQPQQAQPQPPQQPQAPANCPHCGQKLAAAG